MITLEVPVELAAEVVDLEDDYDSACLHCGCRPDVSWCGAFDDGPFLPDDDESPTCPECIEVGVCPGCGCREGECCDLCDEEACE